MPNNTVKLSWNELAPSKNEALEVRRKISRGTEKRCIIQYTLCFHLLEDVLCFYFII